MKKTDSNILGSFGYLILLVIFVSFLAFLLTLLILMISDIVFFEKSIYQTDASLKSGFFSRINRTFAAIVFCISFAGILAAILKSALKGETDDEIALTKLQTDALDRGTNIEVSGMENTFSSSFEIGTTKFNGSFVMQKVGNRSSLTRFCAAKVSFAVSQTDEFFQIEESKSFFDSSPKNYSISPVLNMNATKKLDGRYKYSYSDYRFFNDFISADEISDDLAIPSNHHETKINLYLKNGIFTIKYRQQTSSDENQSRKQSIKILDNLYVRAKKYYERFRQIGLIQD